MKDTIRRSGSFHIKNVSCIKVFMVLKFAVLFDLFLTVDGYNIDERLEDS